MGIEKILQVLLKKTFLTPSIFIVMQKPSIPVCVNAKNIYCCPVCLGSIKEFTDSMKCSQKHSFPQVIPGIIDLRDPRPEEVTF
jgi:hypothetical protein